MEFTPKFVATVIGNIPFTDPARALHFPRLEQDRNSGRDGKSALEDGE